MKANVGTPDRLIRFAAGAVFIAAGVVLETWLGLIGVPLILTAVFRFCPAYVAFGMSSCEPPSES